ncbi:MAG TPA: Ig-like domain-containing protein [Gemmatimonadales bacterium]|nr:Ig-like domain-containing protein [Gemmatimonadales bacterium]
MTTKRLHFSLALFASMTAAAVASECGGNSSGPPPPTTTIQKSPTASGDAQADAVAATLPNPLQVLVTLSGTPQQGTTVTWATSATAASITPTSMTDASGIAMATWTLGHTAGTQTATATLSGATGSPVTFTATATPGAATQLLKSSGDNQTGFVTLTLANPLEVKVTDQFGNGVQGTGVDWQVTTGSASLNPSHATSDASGIAQTTVTLDAPPGAIVITATNGALTGSPITFHATSEALPTTAAVTGGNFFFSSNRNGSTNPAVDTIAVGGTVTWTWIGNHSVQSTGSPSFMSSTIQMNGTHSVTFNSAGTYTYICSVHPTLMSGRVVVK